METLAVETRARTQMLDVTSRVQGVVDDAGVRSGIVLVFVPHTTAAVTVNENADPAVVSDILMECDKVIPFEDGYRHGEGNSAAHIKCSLFGPSLAFPVEDGRIRLGTWQGIWFCEFDGPRRRSLWVQVVGR